MPGGDISIRPSYEQSVKAAARWLVELGKYCAGNISVDMAREKVEAYSQALACIYPAGTLDLTALFFVAAQPELKFWPPYATLIEVLKRCPTLYQPERPRAAPPPSPPEVVIPPDEKERVRIGFEALVRERRAAALMPANATQLTLRDVALKGDALAEMRSQNALLRRGHAPTITPGQKPPENKPAPAGAALTPLIVVERGDETERSAGAGRAAGLH